MCLRNNVLESKKTNKREPIKDIIQQEGCNVGKQTPQNNHPHVRMQNRLFEKVVDIRREIQMRGNEFSRRREERRERAYEFSKRYEEYAYVLDYLPHGRAEARHRYRAGALVQVVGEEFFTLLEAIAKEGVVLKTYDRVYVGKSNREKITYIIGRINYDELTSSAKMELSSVVEKIVLSRESWFINFFNMVQALTPRMHALELIPGIGKKYMWQIIDERERKPFENFEDLQQRANIPSPAKLVTKRILEELPGESKYRLFTRAP